MVRFSICLMNVSRLGQEKATVEYDEDIKITPFNMKEELEEDGYFDGAGNFIFKKSVGICFRLVCHSGHSHWLFRRMPETIGWKT